MGEMGEKHMGLKRRSVEGYFWNDFKTIAILVIPYGSVNLVQLKCDV
jgi:hypothetical protein